MLSSKLERVSVLTSSLPCVLTSSSHRKQHGLGGRSIGKGLELRGMPPPRLRHFHFRAFQDADEVPGVDHRPAFGMIFCDDRKISPLSLVLSHPVTPPP